MSSLYRMVVENAESTVVASYVSERKMDDFYQSEADLEREFIGLLKSQGYEYLSITSEAELVKNLRVQLERVNKCNFSDVEWDRFFKSELANPRKGILEKTTDIQEDYVKSMKRDDGSDKNIYLLRKDIIHDNALQVINQYSTDSGERTNRYDVTILVNGLPLVHIELKRRGVALREAFNQINRYKRESFWSESGLYEYVQLFVISNGTSTKYYSNTIRDKHIDESKEGKKKKNRTSNSYNFTNWWADAENKQINDLIDFTKTFFAKHVLLKVLTRYCVFTTDKQLLVMRPYQITATEQICNRVLLGDNYKDRLGSTRAGGYVWHATGSGKTLTSFKTAQLASKMDGIDKVLFVVDRKDLDYQTMREYDKFEKGAANSNTSTKKLKAQLEDSNARIIVTTIQKLSRFIGGSKKHPIYNKRVVLIFDECHRSQFGEMHTMITRSFKKYHLFGFTGTPIFAANASAGRTPQLKTTEQAFGDKLHTYTIVNAISDENVLPFKVDYVSTVKTVDDIDDKQIPDIDREAALISSKRIENIVRYILDNFDVKTKRASHYTLNDRRLKGFNSIFAVASIDFAKAYYKEFARQQENIPSEQRLKIATIYSFGVNESESDSLDDENIEDTSGLDANSRDFLDGAIIDYNKMFGTSFDTSSDKFQNYYKDISMKVKEREVDILIVVNMFLTGFDATTLNTLWVDKKLQLHGLLQAYSRTNRILNSVKTFGNVVCFRNLEEATNKSISLFGDKDARGIVLLKTFNEYYYGYKDGDKEIIGYESLVQELQETYPGSPIVGEQNEKNFIALFGKILRIRNILETFDDFSGKEIISKFNMQNYYSMYYDLYDKYRGAKDGKKENINDSLIFEMELIKQTEFTIDYILELILKYHSNNIKDKELLLAINKAIDSSGKLRNKKDLIIDFITKLDSQSLKDSDWQKEWHEFVSIKEKEELGKIISEENLNSDATYAFIRNAFQRGSIETAGTGIAEVLPPISRFSPGGERTKKKNSVLKRFQVYFDRFFSISQGKL